MIVSGKLFRLAFGGVGAPQNDQSTCAGQSGMNRFDRVNLYSTAVDTSVSVVGLFGVAKRGLPAWAICSAAW